MAKQTFTTGQVLLASQLTSLQQTAMLGGAASAKTSNYTLVSADAGSAISMTSTSATTVTVNTGLFAAGDTVFIQNLGSGNCTITAGSATVASAGSLILPQNDAGILYFVSTGASVFYDFIQVGAASPLTTKGDVYTFSSSDARLAVGANGTVLTANSATATGLEFATPASGGMTLISTTTLSGASITLSSIPATYNNLFIVVRNFLPATDSASLLMRMNNDSTANRHVEIATYGTTFNGSFNATSIQIGRENDNAVSQSLITVFIPDYANATTWKKMTVDGFLIHNTTTTNYNSHNIIGAYNQTAAISSLGFLASSGNLTSGTVLLYGVK